MLIVVAVAGCSDDAACIEVEVECNRLYEPTFDNVHAMTLMDKCTDGPCHNSVSRRAGMSFENIDDAYMHLVEDGRVEPGNPGCSLMVRRVESTSNGFVMPPGNMLSETERCSIRQWIENGAQR